MEFKFKNPAYPTEERVQDLMERMTLREKLAVIIETSRCRRMQMSSFVPEMLWKMN